MKIISIIPARGGSKGIPKKNIVDVNGQPLISYTILDSLKCKSIEETFVSTDDIEIASIARQYGATVPFLRPKEYATDISSDMQWAWHFILWYERKYNSHPELIVHLRTTTPIRDVAIIEQAIDIMLNNKEASSLRSVEEFSESPYKWFKLEDSYLSSLFDVEDTNAPRQNFSKVYRPNGYVDILRPEVILRGSLHGFKIAPIITPRSMEIDTIEDLDLVRLKIRYLT